MSRTKNTTPKAILPYFVQPMQCLGVHKLPEDEDWTFEVKWDGYRALAVGSIGRVVIYSRNEKRLDSRFANIEMAGLPSRSSKTAGKPHTGPPFTRLI